jgi:hypothetical protein
MLTFREITHPDDLRCRYRFDLRIQVHNGRITVPPITINWGSGIPEEVTDVSLEIDGLAINLSVGGIPSQYYLGGGFRFEHGHTYQFRLAYTHSEQPIEETFDFTFPSRMIVNWPAHITPDPQDLHWSLSPNNNIDNDFTMFSVRRGNNLFEEFICPSIRELRIPDDLGPFPSFSFSFQYTNFVMSGRVSIFATRNLAATYRNGVLERTLTW